MQLRDRLVRLARRLVEIGTDAMRHAVEPLIHGSGDVALARDADLGEGLQAALELGKLGGLHFDLAAPPLHVHDQGHGKHDECEHGKSREGEQDDDRVERDAA